jgi:hypothetical protein
VDFPHIQGPVSHTHPLFPTPTSRDRLIWRMVQKILGNLGTESARNLYHSGSNTVDSKPSPPPDQERNCASETWQGTNTGIKSPGGAGPRIQARKGDKAVKKVPDNKPYRAGFLWAQCTAWFKQTVYDPTASLSAERRGAISLPDPDKAYTAVRSSRV